MPSSDARESDLSIALQDRECGDWLDRVDLMRLDAGRRLSPTRRSEFGQFFTPAPVARLIASMTEPNGEHIRLLDPGAGVGSLTMAWLVEVIRRPIPPRSISL